MSTRNNSDQQTSQNTFIQKPHEHHQQKSSYFPGSVYTDKATHNNDNYDNASDTGSSSDDTGAGTNSKLYGLRVTNPDKTDDDDCTTLLDNDTEINNQSSHTIRTASPNTITDSGNSSKEPYRGDTPPPLITSSISSTVMNSSNLQTLNENDTNNAPLHQPVYNKPTLLTRHESKTFKPPEFSTFTLHEFSSMVDFEKSPNIEISTAQGEELVLPLDNKVGESSTPELLTSPTAVISPVSLISPLSPASIATTVVEDHIYPKTSTNIAHHQAGQQASKYTKVSYHLTNDPSAIKKYREMAEKTNDTTTQLIFAKYLLETANIFFSGPQIKTTVGSMWGVSTPFYSSNKPEPFYVIPPPTTATMNDGQNSDNLSKDYNTSFTSATHSSGNNVGTENFHPMSSSSTSYNSGNHFGNKHTNTTTTSPTVTTNTSSSALRFNHNLLHQNQQRSPQLLHDHEEYQTRKQKSKVLQDEAIKWIKKLSKLDVSEACYMLASWMDNEMYGFKKNKSRSLQLHLVAAKSNIPESVFAVAEHYYENFNSGEAIDASKVVKFYKSASDIGYVNATYKLALLTITGKLGIRQSSTEGLKLMYKACTFASEEFNEPPYTFALMLTNDHDQIDIPLSLLEPYGGKEAAILYYERAARLNNDKSQCKLGSIYEHGLYGESMNFARAFDYYKEAAAYGNGKAMLGLCRLNIRGSHGPGDDQEQYRLENDVSGWLAATPINDDAAFAWCEKAAATGLGDALALLGWFYEIGIGVPRDFAQAEKLYQMATEEGNTGAKTRLLEESKPIAKQLHEVLATANSNTQHAAAVAVAAISSTFNDQIAKYGAVSSNNNNNSASGYEKSDSLKKTRVSTNKKSNCFCM